MGRELDYLYKFVVYIKNIYLKQIFRSEYNFTSNSRFFHIYNLCFITSKKLFDINFYIFYIQFSKGQNTANLWEKNFLSDVILIKYKNIAGHEKSTRTGLSRCEFRRAFSLSYFP